MNIESERTGNVEVRFRRSNYIWWILVDGTVVGKITREGDSWIGKLDADDADFLAFETIEVAMDEYRAKFKDASWAPR